MRSILINTIAEDLTDLAKKTETKTLLLYGAHDTATPPEFGQRYNLYMKNSELIILPKQTHLSPIFENSSQTMTLIKRFLK